MNVIGAGNIEFRSSQLLTRLVFQITYKSTMPFSRKTMAIDLEPYGPLYQSSQAQLEHIVEMFDLLTELARLSRPDEHPEMIEQQEYWAIRQAVIGHANCWEPHRDAFIAITQSMESLAALWESEQMVAIPSAEYEMLVSAFMSIPEPVHPVFFHSEGLRDAIAAMVADEDASPPPVTEQQDWIYGHDNSHNWPVTAFFALLAGIVLGMWLKS